MFDSKGWETAKFEIYNLTPALEVLTLTSKTEVEIFKIKRSKPCRHILAKTSNQISIIDSCTETATEKRRSIRYEIVGNLKENNGLSGQIHLATAAIYAENWMFD